MSPGSAYKSALRDAVVELDVSGREIKDEGFKTIVVALLKTINNDGHEIVKLETLFLKRNLLTIKSLAPLARLIPLAAFDLRELDLSNNNISVNTTEEEALWRTFLVALRTCCALTVLNLSNNILGSKAFEILNMVYIGEQTLDNHLLMYSPGDDLEAFNMLSLKEANEEWRSAPENSIFSESPLLDDDDSLNWPGEAFFRSSRF